MSHSLPTSSAVRALSLELKSMQEEGLEGFRVKLVNDESLFEWEVAIFGPPDTLYQGGYFKVSNLHVTNTRIFIYTTFSSLWQHNVKQTDRQTHCPTQ